MANRSDSRGTGVRSDGEFGSPDSQHVTMRLSPVEIRMLERQQRRVGRRNSLKPSSRSDALRAALHGWDYLRGKLMEVSLSAIVVAGMALLQEDHDLLADVIYSELSMGFPANGGVVALATLEQRLYSDDWPDATAEEIRPAVERLVLERLVAWTPDHDGLVDLGPGEAHAYGKQRAERVARHGLWRAA